MGWFDLLTQERAARGRHGRRCNDPDRGIAAVTHGATAQQTYTFESSTIAIGRGDEVRDSRQQLIRTNDVVFALVLGTCGLGFGATMAPLTIAVQNAVDWSQRGVATATISAPFTRRAVA